MVKAALDLASGFVPIFLAVPLAIVGGIIMSAHDRHKRLGLLLLRAAVVAMAIYPLNWGYNIDVAPVWRVSFVAAVGAFLGASFYGVGVLYKNEADHSSTGQSQ